MVKNPKKNISFVYKVAAVIVDQGRVLLARSKEDHFWSLPGGAALFNEQATDAVRRVMLTDLAEEVEVDRLLWIVENFFNDRKQKIQHHELGFYFLTRLRKGSPYSQNGLSFFGTIKENTPPIEFQWFPQDEAELKTVPIYPLFLKYSLAKLPDEIQHLINQDSGT